VKLSQEKKADLADIIARNVSMVMLGDVVKSQALVLDFDNIRKRAPAEPQENLRAVALAVIEAYESKAGVFLLIEELYRRGWRDSGFAEAMSRFLPLKSPNGGGEQEATFALRANFLQSPKLSEFLIECEPHICVIAAKAEIGGKVFDSTGTGLLVAPDLVLTARHVLKYHISDGRQLDPSPGPLLAFFDHLAGDPITKIDEPLPHALKARTRAIKFHSQKWLIDTCEDIPGEAFGEPNAAQIADLKAKLDYALVRLAEPIGNHSRYIHGGSRRGWFDLSSFAAPELRMHDRIIIQQHPGGQALRIDFGRFNEVDGSGTRLRYNAETASGTSGAPCFNQKFQLVGMHNAAYKPHNVLVFNQAVRFADIMKRVHATYGAFAASEASSLWSVSTDPSSPRVVIGRKPLMEWLKKATDELPSSLKHRIYAAAGTPRSGKSFTLDILKAALRGKSDRLVEFGTTVEMLPTTATDFMTALFTQLGVPREDIAAMPPRPSHDQTEGAAEDKLNVWLSRTLPSWLNGVLVKKREWKADARLDAKQRVDNPMLGLPPDPKDKELAEAAQPLWETRSRWQRIWIVIDNATEESIRPLRELITGLTGARLEESAVAEELQRMRWLFLGDKPDFLGEISWEALDPQEIKADSEAVKECIRNLAESFDVKPHDQMLEAVALFLLEKIGYQEFKTAYDDPLKRLETLQALIGHMQPTFARILRISPS
jgi:hypothetical protein